MKKLLTAGALVATVVLGASACGTDGYSEQQPYNTSPAPSSPPTPQLPYGWHVRTIPTGQGDITCISEERNGQIAISCNW